MPNRRTESASSCWASVSSCFRGCAGSGRMRRLSMRNAPLRRRRPSRAPASEAAPASSGSEGAAVNALRADASAAAAEPLAAALDFVEELPGDAGFFAPGSVEGEGDAVGNTLLELCQIRNHGVKGEGAEL